MIKWGYYKRDFFLFHQKSWGLYSYNVPCHKGFNHSYNYDSKVLEKYFLWVRILLINYILRHLPVAQRLFGNDVTCVIAESRYLPRIEQLFHLHSSRKSQNGNNNRKGMKALPETQTQRIWFGKRPSSPPLLLPKMRSPLPIPIRPRIRSSKMPSTQSIPVTTPHSYERKWMFQVGLSVRKRLSLSEVLCLVR